MELKHIKELMAAMGRTCTKRLFIKKDGFELQLERDDTGVCKPVESSYEMNEEGYFKGETPLRKANSVLSKGGEMPQGLYSATTPPAAKEDSNSLYVTSPMVGTFYESPSPEDPPFVKVGDKIEKNTVVGIIEAMKVMNEIKSGVSGTVAEVLVETGHPVEFGTKLFRVTQ